MGPKTEAARESLRDLLILLPAYIERLKVECPDADIHLGVIAFNEDGSGKIGPSWELGDFADDLALLVGPECTCTNPSDPGPECPVCDVELGPGQCHACGARFGDGERCANCNAGQCVTPERTEQDARENPRVEE